MTKKSARSKIFCFPVLLFLIALLIMTLSIPAAAYSGHGNGTADDPYQISSFDELDEIRYDLSAHYILMTDLDRSDSDLQWKSIGDIYNPFNGTLNGNMKEIKNLNIGLTDDKQCAGLFGQTSENAVIFNLTLVNATITNGGQNLRHAGSLVGYNEGDIINCRTIGAVIFSRSRSGGLVGTNLDGTIENCSAEGNITGVEAGGLVGSNNEGTIKTSSSNASVTGESVGGFVCINYGNISNCMSEGSVFGDYMAGGFAGCNIMGTIEYCYTKNTVDSKTQTGGFVGVNQGHMNNCISINEHINNRPLISKETSPTPPYTRFIFGGGGPVGRIAHANYYAGPEDYTAKIENAYSWRETKTNRWRFAAINGKAVQTADLQSFPESVWSEWDQMIWEKGDDGFPRIKQ